MLLQPEFCNLSRVRVSLLFLTTPLGCIIYPGFARDGGKQAAAETRDPQSPGAFWHPAGVPTFKHSAIWVRLALENKQQGKYELLQITEWSAQHYALCLF